MPKIYRAELTVEQQEDLHRRTRDPHLKPRTRDRLEMIRLSHAGFHIPKIAVILQVSEQRVRHWIKAFLDGGFDALPDARHPGKPPALTPAIVAALRAEIESGERTWTASQLAEWLVEQSGVKMTPGPLGRRLNRAGITWKRTSRSLEHKQAPEAVAAKQAELGELEKQGDAGLIDLCHLDEAGFAMTQPTTYSWFLKGKRLTIPFEANQGRRVNVIGALFTDGPQAGRFEFETRISLPLSQTKQPKKSLEAVALAHGVPVEAIGPINGKVFVDFIWKLAGRPAIALDDWKREIRLWIEADNYSVHKGEAVKAAMPAWEAAGIHLDYLPSYSPELSKIEPVWHDTKHREMTTRSNTRLGDLLDNVTMALQRKAGKLFSAFHSHRFLARAA